MADKKQASTKELIIGFVTIAVIIGAIIWGITVVFSHPKQSHTTLAPKPTQTAATKPEVASANQKLTTILTNLKKQYPHVDNSYVYTATRDGGSGLNKTGYYAAGAAFCDSYDSLYSQAEATTPGNTTNAYGFECGGTIQVYTSTANATKALDYLKSVTTEPTTKKCLTTTQGSTECGYTQSGDVIIHVSDNYIDQEKQDLLNYLIQQVTAQTL